MNCKTWRATVLNKAWNASRNKIKLDIVDILIYYNLVGIGADKGTTLDEIRKCIFMTLDLSDRLKPKIDHDVCIKFIEELNELMCQETGQIPYTEKEKREEIRKDLNVIIKQLKQMEVKT